MNQHTPLLTRIKTTLKKHHSRSGQVSFLMVLQLIPALMMFAFVINIGMLVHAKINLQNSADQAAFAGAASQARLMNRISHLNYLLRMNYKKFLFHYYVMGNSNLRCFPGSTGASGPGQAACRINPSEPFHFQNLAGAGDAAVEFPSVPSVCFPAPDGTNVCKLNSRSTRQLTDSLRNPPGIPGSPEYEAIRGQLARIANIVNWDCAAKGAVNSSLAFAWLYNTDPSGAALGTIQHLQYLVRDIGLIPANILTRARINVLKNYLNAAPQRGVTQQQVDQLARQQELAPVERTVLAYRTAQGNLSAGTDGETNWGAFEAGSLTMTELLPGGIGGSPLLELQDIMMPAFTMFYTYSGQDAPLGSGNTADPGTDGCSAKLGVIDVPANTVPIGVYKSSVSTGSGQQPTRVYYAVKLQAKAHLLFNPFDDLTLTAYGAAAPFGSRIGPIIEDTSIFVQPYTVPDEFIGSDRPAGTYHIPTYPFSADGSITMATSGYLESFIRAMGGNEQSARMAANYEQGMAAAMAPDPWEVGKYNIPVEFDAADGNGFNKYFDSNNYYHFWAPIMPIDRSQSGDDQTPAQAILQAVMSFTGTSSVSATNAVRVQILNAVQRGLDQYMATLSRSQITDSKEETSRIATMMNPIRAGARASTIGFNGQTKIVRPEALATSFQGLMPPIGAATAPPPREGYSVKIVSFPTILQGGGQARTGNTGSGALDGPWVGVSAEDQEAEEGVNLPLLHY